MRDEVQIHNFMLIFQIHACTGPLNVVRMTGQIKISIPECKDSWRVLINEIQSWHGEHQKCLI